MRMKETIRDESFQENFVLNRKVTCFFVKDRIIIYANNEVFFFCEVFCRCSD